MVAVFSKAFSLVREQKCDLEQKNGAICERITPMRTNRIARITIDFKIDVINSVIFSHETPKSDLEHSSAILMEQVWAVIVQMI